jgi:hypothetical protein
MTLKRLPSFASEEEEANWWYENREKHDEEFARAFDEGRVKRGGAVQRLAAAQKAANLTLATEDAMLAVVVAEEKGVEVQTYLKRLIHEALLKEVHQIAVDQVA